MNVPEFNKAVKSISQMIGRMPAIDMYSGVGSIGVSINSVDTFVESDDANIEWLKENVRNTDKIIYAHSEKALDCISNDKVLIVDPPRAGLHKVLVNKINEIKPPKVVYLSCNTSTQARDIERLSEVYDMRSLDIFNFFPRTPHIESLVELKRV